MNTTILNFIRVFCMVVVCCIWILGLINAPNDGYRIFLSVFTLGAFLFIDDFLVKEFGGVNLV